MSLHLRVPDFPQVEEIFDFIQDLEGVNARFQNNQLFVDIRVPGTDTFTGSAIFTPFMGMPNEPIFAFIKTAYGLIGNGE